MDLAEHRGFPTRGDYKSNQIKYSLLEISKMNEEDEHFLSASHRKCILLSGTECHIIKYLLTELARAVSGNIGPRSFLYGPRCARSVLSRPRANIPQHDPRARLVRG